MSIPKRHGRIFGTYFVTSRTWEGHALFFKETSARAFVNTLLEYRARAIYLLHAFVLMPDHFHLIITPANDITLERAVQFIKGGSSHALKESLRSRVPIWQKGFSDHRIRDAADYAIHIRYIEQNPVKRGLVMQPSDYPWSSTSGSFLLDEEPQRLKPLASAARVGTAKAMP